MILKTLSEVSNLSRQFSYTTTGETHLKQSAAVTVPSTGGHSALVIVRPCSSTNIATHQYKELLGITVSRTKGCLTRNAYVYSAVSLFKKTVLGVMLTGTLEDGQKGTGA